MNVAKLIKKIETKAYRVYDIYRRFKYAKHDLLRKIKNMDIRPVSDDEMSDIRSFYSVYGVKVQRKWFELFNSFTANEYSGRLAYYIPHDLYYAYIDPYYSEVRKAGFYDNKMMYDVYFHDIPQPHTIVRKYLRGDHKEPVYLDRDYNLISREEAIKICNQYDSLIFKPATYSSGGRGIEFYSKGDDCLLDAYDALVVQEIIQQHDSLNYLHEDSVNTIRMITLVINNEVRILSSVLRMGQGGARVDNASLGGIFCGIRPSGQLKSVAYDCNGIIYHKHPQGAIFGDVIIPNFDKCKDLVKAIAPRVSSITKLCSWDIAIDVEGNPVLIEANFSFGEVDFHQMCNGPIFGDLTEIVLVEVFGK